jgi:fluoride exporter
MFKPILAIVFGASAGALSRWGLGLWLNAIFPQIPIGTLVANLAGGYIIGVFMGVFAAFPDISQGWHLLIITGFLGALTTFSTFSAEVVGLLMQERYAMAFCASVLHVFGSLSMTLLGVASFAIFRNALR